MAEQTVTLKSPQGIVGTYSPSEYDIEQMISDGKYQRVATGSTERVTVRPHERNRPKRKENALVRALPAIGGIAGGLVGGTAGAAAGGVGAFPGAVGGAAFGGAGGEAIRQHADRLMGVDAPKTAQDAIGSIMSEGGWQGAQEAAGIGLVKGAGWLGKPIMEAALKATPEMAQIAIREGIAQSKAGVDLLKKKIEEAGARTMSILRHSTGLGNRIPAQGFINHVTDELMGKAGDNRLPMGETQERTYEHLKDAFLRRNEGKTVNIPRDNTPFEMPAQGWRLPGNRGVGPAGNAAGVGPRSAHAGNVVSESFDAIPDINPGGSRDLTPIELNKMVKGAEDIADPLYEQAEAAAKGLGPPPLTDTQSATMNFYKGVADNGRKLLREVTKGSRAIDPKTGVEVTLEEAKKRSQELMKLRDVIAPEAAKPKSIGRRIVERTAGPSAGVTVAAFSPGDKRLTIPAGVAAGATITSPRVMSELALFLSGHPAVADAILRGGAGQLPRVIGAFATEGR